jgi:hypothetical protein
MAPEQPISLQLAMKLEWVVVPPNVTLWPSELSMEERLK